MQGRTQNRRRMETKREANKKMAVRDRDIPLKRNVYFFLELY
ncbi:hypothetical protein QG37_01688 [Candidozyma auris]|uniref:Uncharacterized protein n=1 Tax=Candidozyma auris TaxID=498019 RepID=A0A0L0P3D7_CANAR|nr:hypothetical protein QG37_01688 [[Candida] auris]